MQHDNTETVLMTSFNHTDSHTIHRKGVQPCSLVANTRKLKSLNTIGIQVYNNYIRELP